MTGSRMVQGFVAAGGASLVDTLRGPAARTAPNRCLEPAMIERHEA